MASIRQRAGTWQARVRHVGFPEEVRSFKTKTEVPAWARTVEVGMDQGTDQDTRKARELLLKDILQRYMQKVSPTKRIAKREAEGLGFMLRQKIAASYCARCITFKL